MLSLAVGGVTHAEVGASWTYLKAGKLETFGSTLLPQAQIKEVENKAGALSFETKSKTEVTTECESAAILEGGLLIGNGAVSLGRVVFHGCEVYLNGRSADFCLPRSNGGEFDLIRTQKLSGLTVLHKLASGTLDPLIRLTPDTGTILATIDLGPECSIAEFIPIEGVLYLRDPAFTTHSTDHLLEPGPLTALTAFGQPATLEGSALVRLVGAHEGLQWAGLPA